MVIELHRQLFFLLHFWADVIFLTGLATSHPQPTTSVQHGEEVEDKGHIKNFVVIFIFVKVFCIVWYFF
jgi:hypothetical protein